MDLTLSLDLNVSKVLNDKRQLTAICRLFVQIQSHRRRDWMAYYRGLTNTTTEEMFSLVNVQSQRSPSFWELREELLHVSNITMN